MTPRTIPLLLLCSLGCDPTPSTETTTGDPPTPDASLATPPVAPQKPVPEPTPKPSWPTDGPVYTFDPATGDLFGPDHDLLINLLPTVRAQRNTRARFRPTNAPGPWSARATTPHATYTLTLLSSPHQPYLDLEISTVYTQEVDISREHVEFLTPGGPRVLDSSMRWTRGSDRVTHVSQHTPRRLRLSKHAVLDVFGSPEVRVGRGVFVWELDDKRHHPFAVYPGCPSKANKPTRPLSTTPRVRGASHVQRARLHLRSRLPALPRRYPRGFDAAISLTDHADQGQLDRTRAFAYGASRGAPSGGFVGRGLRYTKTAFLEQRGSYAPQGSDPKFRGLLRELQRDGTEIGVHSVSGLLDTPARTDALLSDFHRDFTGRTWIDHGPHHNCEALSALGHDPSSPHHIVGVLERHGFDTLWSVHDVPIRGLNMLDVAPGKRRPVLYRHDRLGQGAVLFDSAWFFIDRARFLRRFSDKNLARLAHDHGVLFAHTYLDTWSERGKFAPRTLLTRDRAGFRLRPDVDARFAAIAKLQRAGRVLTSGAGPLAHHILGAAAAELRPLPDGSWRLTHRGRRPLQDLTLRVPGRPGAVRVDGQPPKGTRGQDLWFDLEKDATLTFDDITSPGGQLVHLKTSP